MSTPDETGRCGRIVDEQTETVCNKSAVAEVLVRNKFGLMVVPLCQEDLEAHRAFYRQLNEKRRQPRRGKSRRTPHQGDTSASPNLKHIPGSSAGPRSTAKPGGLNGNPILFQVPGLLGA